MRKLIGAFVVAAAGLAALPAQAITFTYNWVGTGSTGGGTVGSGSMSFNAASVSDAANFSGLTFLSSLTSLNYSWVNGTTTRTVSFAGPALSQLYANNTLTAVNGVLSNVVISDFPNNSFALSIAPSTISSVGISENSSTGTFIDRDQGAWRLATPVPEPAALTLMSVGLVAVLSLARRRA